MAQLIITCPVIPSKRKKTSAECKKTPSNNAAFKAENLFDVYNNIQTKSSAVNAETRQFVNFYKLLRILSGTEIITLLDDLEDFEIHRQKTYGILKQIPVSVQVKDTIKNFHPRS